jgi:hypothetical protein
LESELLRNLSELLFQPVTIGDVHPVKLLELVEQLLRRSRVVTVTFALGDDLALVGNMPFSFGNVPPSQRQMVQYQGSVWHTSSNARQVRPFRPREPAGALAARVAASFVTAKMVNPAAGSGVGTYISPVKPAQHHDPYEGVRRGGLSAVKPKPL